VGRSSPRLDWTFYPQQSGVWNVPKKNGTDIQGKRTDVGMDIETYKDLLGATRS